MAKIVVLTGAGMSAESGLSTFRDAGGLWENYPVQQVASHEGWEKDPVLVNNFYNMLRKKLVDAQPNDGHKLIKELEKKYDVTVITQNVDNLQNFRFSQTSNKENPLGKMKFMFPNKHSVYIHDDPETHELEIAQFLNFAKSDKNAVENRYQPQHDSFALNRID